MKYLATLIIALIFYVLSAPALQVWVVMTYSFASSAPPSADLYAGLPPWTRVIKVYNQPLNWVAQNFEITRKPLQSYDRWLAYTYVRLFPKP